MQSMAKGKKLRKGLTAVPKKDLYHVYMPIAMSGHNTALPPRTVGVDIAGSYADAMAIRATGARAGTLGNFLWSSFEPVRGQYNMSVLDAYEARYNYALVCGLLPFATIFGTPSWALENATGPNCGPMRMDAIPNFVAAANMLLQRCPQIKRLQIWNEQDSEIGASDHYGCFPRAYLSRYVAMTQQAYQLKTFRSDIEIAVGLMLPNDSFSWYETFLNAGGLVDVLHLHHYLTWYPNMPPSFLGDWYNTTTTAGDKVTEAKHYKNIPIWFTETNLLFDQAPTPEYKAAKLSFMDLVAQDAFSFGAAGILFYAWKSGWRGANIGDDPATIAKLTSLCTRYNR